MASTAEHLVFSNTVHEMCSLLYRVILNKVSYVAIYLKNLKKTFSSKTNAGDRIQEQKYPCYCNMFKDQNMTNQKNHSKVE